LFGLAAHIGLPVRMDVDTLPGHPPILVKRGTCRLTSAALPAATQGTLLQLFQNLVHTEAAGFLVWRKFLERSEKVADDFLHRNEEEQMSTNHS